MNAGGVMNSLNHSTRAATCAGRIVAIDLPNRTLRIRLNEGNTIEVTVESGCRITLNCEPVRLRLLAVGDSFGADLTEVDGQFIATAISVDTPGLIWRN
jgi:hypothetical protein